MLQFPVELKDFTRAQAWIFAKTYSHTWPHEYIVRERVEKDHFIDLVQHIRRNGYEGRFYTKIITYFDDEDMVYWTMGAPVDETTIVNRCQKEQTYEYRLTHGTLPESKHSSP